MKRSELVFTAILIPIDFAMLLFAAMLAYFLRFSSSLSETYPVQFELPFGEYFILVLFIIPFWLLIFSLAGLYNLRKKRRLIDDFYSVFLGVSTGMTALVLLIFFRHELFSSRFLVVANWFLAIIFVTIGRVIIKMIRAYLYRYDYGTRRVIIIGQSQECKYLVNHFQNDIGAGYRVINHFKELEKEEIKKIRRNVERGKVDEIINCDPEIPKGKTARLIEIADAARVQYKYIPDFFETKATNIDVNTVAGIPVVALKRTPLDGWWQIIKRLLDFVISFFGLIVLAPLMGLVALMIKIDSPGPVLYRNTRVGYKGKEFNTLKFRSMKIEYCTGNQYGGKSALEYEKDLIKTKSKRKGPIYKVLDDPRRTKFGKFLERTSLDEIPQIINVLKGQMSLAGPRPHQPREVEKYSKRHHQIFAIKPGITGLAQISGRSDLDYNEEYKLDLYYMENWSLGMDLQILLRTPFTLLERRNFA